MEQRYGIYCLLAFSSSGFFGASISSSVAVFGCLAFGFTGLDDSVLALPPVGLALRCFVWCWNGMQVVLR